MHHLVFFSHRYKISLWIFDIWLRALKRWMSEEEEESMKSSLESDIAPSSPYPIRSPGKVCHWNCKKEPNFDLVRHQIVFLSGLPGSGKSSTGRALAALFNEFNIFAIRTKFWLRNNLDFLELIFTIMELVLEELTLMLRIFHRNSSCLICQPDSLEAGITTDCQI